VQFNQLNTQNTYIIRIIDVPTSGTARDQRGMSLSVNTSIKCERWLQTMVGRDRLELEALGSGRVVLSSRRTMFYVLLTNIIYLEILGED